MPGDEGGWHPLPRLVQRSSSMALSFGIMPRTKADAALSVGVRIGHGHPQARRFEVLDRWQEVDKRHALAFDDRADLCRDVGERIGLQFAQLGNMEDDELGAEIARRRGEAGEGIPGPRPAGRIGLVERAIVALPVGRFAELAQQRIELCSETRPRPPNARSASRRTNIAASARHR